jgi:hypothetical protein
VGRIPLKSHCFVAHCPRKPWVFCELMEQIMIQCNDHDINKSRIGFTSQTEQVDQ